MKKLIVILLTAALAACNGVEDVQTKYSGYTARFNYSPVSACPSLQRACTGMGEFCIVDRPIDPQQRFRVRDNIGLPNLAEMGTNTPGVICFDGICPNCYTNSHITKQVSLKDGQATCAACQRIYDLNSQGIVTSEQGGHTLYRYAVGYNGTGVYVSNN